MCLTKRNIKLKFTKERALQDVTQVTTVDMIVYKRFTRYKDEKGNYIYKTPHRSFHWNPERTVKVPEFTTATAGDDILQVNQGLHAYLTKEMARLKKGRYQCVVPMIIPKGTKYITSDPEDGEIVALAMKMKLPKKRNDRPKGADPKSSKKRVVKKKK
jgi:hypothetical protein